jgi:putative CocE/NonD family hydrolase
MNWRGGGTATRVNGMLHPTAGILTFTSGPLEEDLEVTGPIKMMLFASSSERDADFYVRVVDQAPDAEQLKGYPPKARMLTWGWLKASHRRTDPALSMSYRPWHIHENPEPIELGKIYPYEIEVMPTSNLFLKGHRIRIDFSNGDSWMFDSAHHYGLKYGKDRIYHDREHPSHIVLPVIPR